MRRSRVGYKPINVVRAKFVEKDYEYHIMLTVRGEARIGTALVVDSHFARNDLAMNKVYWDCLLGCYSNLPGRLKSLFPPKTYTSWNTILRLR